jgi:hypothetical protein
MAKTILHFEKVKDASDDRSSVRVSDVWPAACIPSSGPPRSTSFFFQPYSLFQKCHFFLSCQNLYARFNRRFYSALLSLPSLSEESERIFTDLLFVVSPLCYLSRLFLRSPSVSSSVRSAAWNFGVIMVNKQMAYVGLF